MPLSSLDAEVVIDSISLDGYVNAVNIRGTLCGPGATGEVRVAPTYPNSIEAGQSVAVTLNGTLVLTGSVVQASQNRPEQDIVVGICDEYLRVSRYFNPDRLTTETITSCSSLIGQILSPTGISYSVTAPDALTPAGVQIGLRFAHEALFDVITYMSAYAYCDPDGTLKIQVLGQGDEHTVTEANNITDFIHKTSDETARTTIKVHGSGGLGPTGQGRIFASAHRDVAGVFPDRIAVVGSELIETQAEAGRVAHYLLNELGSLDEVVTVTMNGTPTIKIGDFVRTIFWDYSGKDAVTSLEHNVDDVNGFTTKYTTGERCPRIAGFSRYAPPVYAGTSGSGIFRSTDGGITWTDFNTGLPTGNRFARRIAANYFDEVMSIVNNRVYYHNGIQWYQRTIPNPVNTAGDSPAPTTSGMIFQSVSPMGASGAFSLLATKKMTSGSAVQDGRTWVYTTTTSGSTWESVELDGGSTGSGFHVLGMDISSRYGTPYVVATSGSLYGLPAGEWYKGNLKRIDWNKYYRNELGSIARDEACGNPPGEGVQDGLGVSDPNLDVGVIDYNILDAVVTGTAPSRALRVSFEVFGRFPAAGVGALGAGLMVAFTTPDFLALGDTSPIALTNANADVDNDDRYRTVRSPTWSSAIGCAPNLVARTFDCPGVSMRVTSTITFLEGSEKNFSARILFPVRSTDLFETTYVRTGEQECDSEMFTGPNFYTHAEAGWMWFSFDLLDELGG